MKGPTPAILVIGCGAVVDGLYRGPLQRLESRHIARVVGLVDPDPRRTAALQRAFRSAEAFTTAGDAFARLSPHLTIVASPPGRHAEHATAALSAGSHVLCEKPMAVSAAEAERMIAAARLARRVLAVGMVRRFYPALAEARALLDEGVCGEPLSFRYREGHVYSWPVSTDAAFRRSSAGGGVLTDFGSHVIDFLSALFGAPAVSSYADDARLDGVESNCLIGLEFPRARGTVQLSWSQPLVSGLRVSGPDGDLFVDPGRFDVVRWRTRGGRWTARTSRVAWPRDLEPVGRRDTPLTYYDCIYHQVVQALRAIVLEESVPASGEDGLIAVRAIDACYQRALPLAHPWLSSYEQEDAERQHWSRQRWAA